ncbi:MAG: GGDEF domain-containing protein [Clostridia bacterium]|nr:GGDEF domain-containing protein [Clostridia bacterium]
MSRAVKRRDEKTIFQSGITDYEAFLKENQKKINLMLNKFLRFSILIGPLLMLAIRFGIFHSVTYASCVIVSLLVLSLSCIHYVLTMREGNTVRAAVIAFLAIDTLLVLMNSAHIGIYITWFVVPLISLLFCDFKVYAIAVAINYAMMTLSVWLVSPYYASLRVDFDRPFQYFAGRMGGFTIETAIMVVAGYCLCRLSTSYYRELIEKYRILSDNKRQMNAQMAILESMSEIYEYASLIDLDAMTETAIRDTRAADRHASGTISGGQSRMNAKLMPSIAAESRQAFADFADLSGALTRMHDVQSMDREFLSAETGWFRAQYIVVERRPDGAPARIIYTIQNIDRQKRREEQLIRISMTDELTGLANRRGYDTDMAALRKEGMGEDFVLFSVDVNGLKEANDTRGHVAGDELLMATAECLTTVIGPIGKVYRTGGDEFLATAMTDAPSAVLEEIRSRSAAWRGAYGEALSLSVGYAARRDHPDADIHGLEIRADQMMYRAKSRYYSAPGTDRRRNHQETA